MGMAEPHKASQGLQLPMSRPPKTTRRPTPTIDPGVRIGHVHLKVADLERALDFYCGVLGFELTTHSAAARPSSRPAAITTTSGSTPGRATAASRRRPARPASTTPPSSIRPGALLADALRRLIDAGIPLDGASDHGVSEALYLRDPDDNGVELYWDRPKEQWPQKQDGSLQMFTHPLDLHDLLAELDKETAALPRGFRSSSVSSTASRDREHDREGDVVAAGGVEDGGAQIGADAAEDVVHHDDQAGERAEVSRAEALAPRR